MRISQQLSVLTLSATIVIVLVAVSAYYSVTMLTDSHRAVYNSASTLGATQELCFHIAYASACQRAYIITNKESVRDQYRSEIEMAKQTLSKLRGLIDDPDERVLLERLDKSMTERIASLEMTVNEFELHGQAAAFERIKQGVGLAVMTKTIKQANELCEYELKQIGSCRRIAEGNSKSTEMTIFLGSALAIAIILISHKYLAYNLSSAVENLLRASQNIVLGRFESRANTDGNNELSDIGRAFNTLSGHLKAKTEALESLNARLATIEIELFSKSQSLEKLEEMIGSLNMLVQETAHEFTQEAEHLKAFEEEFENASDAANQSRVALTKILGMESDIQSSADIIERKYRHVNDRVEELKGQSVHVSGSLESVWNKVPLVKDSLAQLASLDNEIAVLEAMSAVANAKQGSSTNPEFVVIVERLKEFRQLLNTLRSGLGSNVTQVQQSTSEALSTTSRFEGILNETKRPLDTIDSGTKQLVQLLGASRIELAELNRLHQRYTHALDILDKRIDLLGIDAVNDRNFAEKLKLRLKELSAILADRAEAAESSESGSYKLPT
ncbi:MAG: CHASE3 domain-containing protein [Candidatus Obscuribacterales bacterium]|nr:CHASE3 domain-containing protein [Candidatus Obscuribacterales bacterium]